MVPQAVVVLALACCASGHLRAASPGWLEKRAGGMFGDFVMHGETVDRVASQELYGGLPPRFQATAAQTGRVAPDSYADVVLSEGGAVGDTDTAARAGGDADATESDPYGSLLTGLHANHPRHAKELLAEDKARKEAFVVEAAEDKAATAHGRAAQTSATMRKEAKEAFVHEAAEDKTASSALAALASSGSRSDGGGAPANSGTSKNEGKELDTAMKSAGAALDSATATLQSGGNQQTSDPAPPAANAPARRVLGRGDGLGGRWLCGRRLCARLRRRGSGGVGRPEPADSCSDGHHERKERLKKEQTEKKYIERKKKKKKESSSKALKKPAVAQSGGGEALLHETAAEAELRLGRPRSTAMRSVGS